LRLHAARPRLARSLAAAPAARGRHPPARRRSVARGRRPPASRIRLGLHREPAPPLLPGQEAAARFGRPSANDLLGDVPRPLASVDRVAAFHRARGDPRVAPRRRPDRTLDRVLLDVAARRDAAVLARAVPPRALLAACAPRRRAALGAG